MSFRGVATVPNCSMPIYLREYLCKGLGFSKEERGENVRPLREHSQSWGFAPSIRIISARASGPAKSWSGRIHIQRE